MILRNLSILNFKNIGEASLEFSPKLNCFLGSNGEGKTNLLDAIYYLSFCRSAFNPIDSQVIKHDADFLMLDAAYATDEDEPVAVYCGMKRGQKGVQATLAAHRTHSACVRFACRPDAHRRR